MVEALARALSAEPNDFHMLEQKAKVFSKATVFEETFDNGECEYYYVGKR